MAGNYMALATRGGWKERHPALNLFDLSAQIDQDQGELDLGFHAPGWSVYVDEPFKLVWHNVRRLLSNRREATSSD